ncbi:hypothetical protein Zmor_021453 [Zophobas morio]|uniref:GST C-terminal domain-containing protein n=1 Tax=Zophobas morio TaxID=2755281 RepID=A0AA38I5C3_9CUCU|nr:hypothetical protein Zmor_021453 [Zophobas morio]
MVVNAVKPLNQLASFLKLQAGKITFSENTLPTRVVNKNSTFGYINIVIDLIKQANSNLEGCTDLEKAEVRQWIEYAILYAAHSELSHQVLRELNAVLATRTYLVSHRLTAADLFLYYILQPTMENLAILDKERFVHVSRWFDNLQQDSSIRQSNKLVNFSTLYLASVAPARH